MAAPRQMTANTLNALKGWPQMNAVDYTSSFDASVTSVVPAGSVVSLNSSGKFILGVGNSKVMPMFLFANSDDPDIINDGGDASTVKGVFIPIGPTGQAMALVATGSYELVSTSYVSGSYPPNTALTSPLTTSNAGKLVAGTMGTNMIVGLVSRGVVDNGYGKNALAFWPCPVFPA
jgi:hypothetical protein